MNEQGCRMKALMLVGVNTLLYHIEIDKPPPCEYLFFAPCEMNQ